MISKIVKIEQIENDSKRYDISVENTSCFFANGILVHNCENMAGRLPIGEKVDVTLKIDGQSWSAYYNIDTKDFGVLGRTLEYKEECNNRYTSQIERYDIKSKLITYCEKHGVSLCIRGESYGEGIQQFAQNPHSKEKPGLAIFSVYNIKTRKYERRSDEFYFITVADELGLPVVPILERDVVLTEELINKYSVGLKKLDGKPFEGVVINHGAFTLNTEIRNIELPDGSIKEVGGVISFDPGSFKVISKHYDSQK